MATRFAVSEVAPLSLAIVRAPESPVFRVAKLGRNPFDPPPPNLAGDNRFNDPEARFSVVYCASERAGAFGETIADFRRSIALLEMLAAVEDDEPVDEALFGLLVPGHPERGVVPADWRFKRQIGCTVLSPHLRFVDILAPESMTHLRLHLGSLARRSGFGDVDSSTILSATPRSWTQAAARYVYEVQDDVGEPAFAGIRYRSRLNLSWTCWAIFRDRMIDEPGTPQTSIDPKDPDLLEAARSLGLCIEALRSGTHFICP